MGRSIKLSSKGYAAAALSAAGFGAMGLFAQSAYAAGWPPELLLAARFSIAAILFWAFMPLSGGGWRVSRKTLFQLAGMGIAGYALMALLLFFAYRFIPVGAAVTVFYTYPIWVSLLHARKSRAKTGVLQYAPPAVSFIGLVVMFMSNWEKAASDQALGYFLALFCSVVYALYILVSEHVLKQSSAYVSSAYIAGFAAIPLIAVAWMTGSLDGLAGPGSLQAWGAAGGLALFSTFGAITLFAYGVRLLGPNRASVISYLEPILAAALSAAFLQQYLTPQQITGGVIVLVGVLFMQRKDARTHGLRPDMV
ncbi:DMT family transporter [Paenibacillus nanensis]|uniref:DMT family transporter n=1 Tax=Paenibacillus nanensis TaxID=393251 RepID=A0A3A1UUR6_9BACL|nr:DMT family transporter [Paenibacillus nanensis]RIX51506.1 DMT family transporter [Paenibacillus nanensis]